MGKGLRLQLENPKDREWLAKLTDRTTGRSMLETVQGLMETQAMLEEKSPDFNDGDQKARQKYRNNCFWALGYYWQSTWEYHCYLSLMDLERRKTITNLRRQQTYTFEHNGVVLGKAVADFVFDKGDFKDIVAEAKHYETAKQPKWKWQLKCFKAFYNIDVLIFWKGDTDVEKVVQAL